MVNSRIWICEEAVCGDEREHGAAFEGGKTISKNDGRTGVPVNYETGASDDN